MLFRYLAIFTQAVSNSEVAFFIFRTNSDKIVIRRCVIIFRNSWRFSVIERHVSFITGYLSIDLGRVKTLPYNLIIGQAETLPYKSNFI